MCDGPRLLSVKVCSVLESLEQEYKREEDWCGGGDKLGPNCETDHVTPMISKHLEQKEAFLKVSQNPIRAKLEDPLGVVLKSKSRPRPESGVGTTCAQLAGSA